MFACICYKLINENIIYIRFSTSITTFICSPNNAQERRLSQFLLIFFLLFRTKSKENSVFYPRRHVVVQNSKLIESLQITLTLFIPKMMMLRVYFSYRTFLGQIDFDFTFVQYFEIRLRNKIENLTNVLLSRKILFSLFSLLLYIDLKRV